MKGNNEDPDFWSFALNNLDYMISIREHIHAHPELSDEEFETANLVFEELNKFGVENVKKIAQTGVTGVITGDLPGPTILLRADMDALEIDEQVDVPYRSQKKGIMHACGHDGHTASLLGVAKILMENKCSLKGKIVLAFQPAEEGEGGAKRMIEEGILENPKVDYAFAFHVSEIDQEGMIGLFSGGFQSSCDDITIEFHGVGGHGSTPHLCVNPIDLGMDFLQRIRTYIANGFYGGENNVLSFGQFVSGYAGNIIPDQAELKGSLRTYHIESRKLILEKIEECLQQTVSLYGGHFTLKAHPFAPVLYNDPDLLDKSTSLLKKYCDPNLLVFLKKPAVGSEDFAFFSEKVPSLYYTVGVCKDKQLSLHSPDFEWRSHVLKYSCWSMLCLAYHLNEYVATSGDTQ